MDVGMAGPGARHYHQAGATGLPQLHGDPRRIPIRVWHVVRVVSVCAYIALCIALSSARRAACSGFSK